MTKERTHNLPQLMIDIFKLLLGDLMESSRRCDHLRCLITFSFLLLFRFVFVRFNVELNCVIQRQLNNNLSASSNKQAYPAIKI